MCETTGKKFTVSVAVPFLTHYRLTRFFLCSVTFRTAALPPKTVCWHYLFSSSIHVWLMQFIPSLNFFLMFCTLTNPFKNSHTGVFLCTLILILGSYAIISATKMKVCIWPWWHYKPSWVKLCPCSLQSDTRRLHFNIAVTPLPGETVQNQNLCHFQLISRLLNVIHWR